MPDGAETYVSMSAWGWLDDHACRLCQIERHLPRVIPDGAGAPGIVLIRNCARPDERAAISPAPRNHLVFARY